MVFFSGSLLNSVELFNTLWYSLTILILVLCVCVCVCVCVYTLPPAGFFQLHEVSNIHEMFGSAIFYCE